ncbi:SGNH/GDSL hydrolase family protein [Candidatus Daviesbacteria bacterium]|nr:SGNH/GDSL hydrolase family protein [Candidatus Daviesbacteria bacterium]
MPLQKIGVGLIPLAILGLTLFTIHLLPNPKKENSTKPTLIEVQGKTKVKYPQDFTIVLVGDSMTEYLGNSDELRTYLKNYYPDKTFEVLNYGFGSTNILSLQKRLEEKTFHGREFRPILDIDFDVLLIESFGHNPLSDFPLQEGLQKQTQALEKAVATIKKGGPRAKIIFVGTLGPNKKLYAYRAVDLSPEKRIQWANERIAYIKNHLDFAQKNQIPVINVYEKSLDKNGDTKLEYISDTDHIHPSPNGIIFLSREMADFIFQNHLL